MRGVKDRPHQILTDRKACTMSALTELRGLSLMTTKICSSFSKPMKLPNHDFLASLVVRQKSVSIQERKLYLHIISLRIVTYSGLDSGVRLDMSSDVGTKRHKSILK